MKSRISYLILWSLVLSCALFSCSKTEPEEVPTPNENCSKFPREIDALIDVKTITAPINIVDVSISEPCLTLKVSYGGGCEDHRIELEVIEDLSAFNIRPTYFGELQHYTDDQCEALITEEIGFDMSNLDIVEGQVLELTLAGWEETIRIQY